MYPGKYATTHLDRAAFIMASTGEAVSYAEFEGRSNRLAQLPQSQGLVHEDHYSVFMENNNRYLEACAAGERAGLYYTCINSFLTAEEVAYIIQNSESQVLITSVAKQEVAPGRGCKLSQLKLILVVDGDPNNLSASARITQKLVRSTAMHQSPTNNWVRQCCTRREQPVVRRASFAPCRMQSPVEPLPIFQFLGQLWGYQEDMVYLSPAPLYHSAPQAAVNLALRIGGTVIIMERFDAMDYLALVERYQVSHSQLVPTMFSRMLKLPEQDRTRHDLSSAARCGTRRSTLPGNGERTNDRLVGTHHSRILRRHRRLGLCRL